MFLFGRRVGNLPDAFNEDGSMPTWMHSLLRGAGTSQGGYRVGDSEHVPYMTIQNVVTWDEFGQIWNEEQVLVCGEGVCNNGPQNLSHISFVCQMVPNSEQLNSSMKAVQFRENWPVKLESLFMKGNLSSGCFETVDGLTILMCAQSQSTRECLLSMYVDSLLPASMESKKKSWLRFAKVDFNVKTNSAP
ncbi:hypothetical protein P879_03797 [Paragonimus westermani]|uniref:Uncharacterized protein n=1 Tax=Paragonimus westermani TaxID=34504 RepID=A0A8T0DSI6_9TREM|nr:hypothetical protein P879_03797 [Paragonimus westermani]